MFQSRFKFYLVPEKDLIDEARDLQIRIQPYLDGFDHQQLHAADLVVCVLMEIMEKRRPGQWYMKHSAATFQSTFISHSLATSICSDRPLFRKLAIQNPGEYFQRYAFKKLPGEVSTLLQRWSRNEVNLFLTEKAVPPYEMLKLQASGHRIVTLSRESLFSGALVDGRRDAFEFLLHDLVHAALFFSKTHEEQVHFFKLLLNGYSLFEEDMKRDREFTYALEYTMSDMNTSKEHLVHSLRAACINLQKREEGLAKDQRLSDAGEQKCRLKLDIFMSL